MPELHTLRRLLLIPPVAVGVVILIWALSEREAPVRAQGEESARSVRVIEARALRLVPRAEGFGPVRPARVWSAVAEVGGRVIETHAELANGELVTAATLLLRIDPADYQLAIAQAEAQLAELEVAQDNARASLAIEERALALAGREFRRVSDLAAKGTLSQSDADSAERTVLATRTSVQSLRNTLALIPAQRRTLQAQLDRSRRDLEKTFIRAPFDLRIAALAVERDQFVASGQKLLEGDSVHRVEVVAQFHLPQIRDLLVPDPDMVVSVEKVSRDLAELTGFRPIVQLDLGGDAIEWEAQFVRISDTIDPHTRTLGIVVAVDRPFEQAIPGVRPPLTKGMFVRVILRGRPQPDRILVPRSAVRGGHVYLADTDRRLRRRPVTVAFEQDDFSVIASGVSDSDTVVVSDLIPAVEGMLLVPVVDEELQSAIRRAGENEQ